MKVILSVVVLLLLGIWTADGFVIGGRGRGAVGTAGRIIKTVSAASPAASTGYNNNNAYSQRATRDVPQMGLQLTFGEGRVCLVTGAGRGIGKAIAKKLAAGGMGHVICVSKTGCEDVVKEIESDGGQASSYAVDVGNSADVAALTDKLLTDHGHIDVLVNNAGITKDNLFLRMTETEWLDVINTNLNSVFYFTSPIAKKMIRNKFGRIINMASVVGVGGNAGQANYAASKAAVIGFTRSLAKELASRNITVNAVAPGFITTQMTKTMSDQARKFAISQIPAGRMGTVDEVADMTAFLASDQAGYVNGKVMPVDGALLF
eukprot:GHVS01103165.1.p1 GENE.GHVS01103165.1~~GHVS01103165.1.p1  ORF type:complete len:319 (+),score=57.43 GHVS01103165.1:154-1110(+)